MSAQNIIATAAEGGYRSYAVPHVDVADHGRLREAVKELDCVTAVSGSSGENRGYVLMVAAKAGRQTIDNEVQQVVRTVLDRPDCVVVPR